MPAGKVLEVLTMDQMRVVLGKLEKIEIEAIQIMAMLRTPHQTSDFFCDYSNILVDIQIKIRDFRVVLSKNSGGWSRRNYQEFLVYAAKALEQCNRAAVQRFPVCNQYNQY